MAKTLIIIFYSIVPRRESYDILMYEIVCVCATLPVPALETPGDESRAEKQLTQRISKVLFFTILGVNIGLAKYTMPWQKIKTPTFLL